MHPLSLSIPLAVNEPITTALLLTALGILIAFSVVFSRAVNRIGVPVVLLFLVLGMLGGSEGIGGVPFDNYALAVRLGTTALVLILFDGGLNTSLASIRRVLLPAGALATAGVAATAGLMALLGRLLGLSWTEALVIGAVASSTDAAAVFAVLRGGNIQLRPRLARTIEVESCVNDPMAVILTLIMIQIITAQEFPGSRLLLDIPLQLVIGAFLGVAVGYLGRILLQRVHLPTAGLYPALTLSLALISFGATTLAQGSGFLAVYATAVVLGNGVLPYRSGLTRIHDAMAWLSQIGMFLMLGLLVFPSQLVSVASVGLALGVLLALVIRPVAVLACLAPFRYEWAERLYIGWAGLRGAVPIILATFPVLAQVPGSDRIFNIVFFVVVVSTVIPGSTLRFVSRRLKLDAKVKPAPATALEINASHPLSGELVSFFITPDLAVCDARLSDIEFPEGSAVILIARGKELLAAKGNSVLQNGDHAYVFFRPENRPFIELLFGRPEET